MRRAMFAFLVAATACGGQQKVKEPPPPLPEPKVEEAKKPDEPPPVEKPEPPAGPIELTLPSAKTTVKLVSPGKGKREALRFTPKAGTKQQVELALDFSGKTSGAEELGGNAEDVMPTLVLNGEAEVKAVDKDGNSEYQLTVTGSDARDVAGQKLPTNKAKEVLAAVHGLTIAGTIKANGSASDLTLRIAEPKALTAGALQLITLALPTLPVLPTEPIGAGAKWQVISTLKFANQLDVTQTTDYQVVSHKGNAWTIKGTTKVTGADQTVESAKMSKITGAGAIDATVVDGVLYPTMKSQVQTAFDVTVSGADPKTNQVKTIEGKFDLKQGAAITPKS